MIVYCSNNITLPSLLSLFSIGRNNFVLSGMRHLWHY